jgi:NTP pyrophosphatase (non-canonical NTP hydrolase)
MLMDGMGSFQERYLAWARATFPTGTAESASRHLVREAGELAESLSPDEAADCLMLLLFIADKMGWDLTEEAERKLLVNQSRQWEPPNAEGWQHHSA